MKPCRLAATDLGCRRGDRELFRGLAFVLEPGQALQVTGANGIGKSSLIRILAGLLPPAAGTVAREGPIGLIDERPALDPHRPLGSALAFWADFDGKRLLPREPVVDELGLGDLLDVPVRYLSTGQQKRAALARLIGQHAAIWLLDEPLNGLDSAAVLVVETLVADHCAAGGICLVASHQPLEVPAITRIELADYAT